MSGSIATMPGIEHRGRRRWRWRTILGVLVVGLFMTLAAGWIGFGLWARHRLDAQLAAIRDAGEPMTWAEITGPVTTTEAGREYLAAFERMTAIGVLLNTPVLHEKPGPGSDDYTGDVYLGGRGDRGIPDYAVELPGEWFGAWFELGFPNHTQAKSHEDALHAMIGRFHDHATVTANVTPEDDIAASEMIRPYEPVFVRLVRAARREPCQMALGEPPWQDMPAFIDANSAAWRLFLRGMVQARSGQTDAAAETVIALFGLCRLFQSQRPMTVHLGDRRAASLGLLVLGEMFSNGGLPSAAQRRDLRAAMERLYQPEQLTRALMFERLGLHEMMEQALARGGGYRVRGFRIGDVPAPLVVYGQAQYLEDMTQMVAGSRRGFPDMFEAMAVEPSGVLAEEYGYGAYIATIDARFVILLRSVQTALAIEEHRHEHGSLPSRLDQLVPQYIAETPVDPFIGQPLRYRVEAERYLIYGVGSNGMDDGGKVKRLSRNNNFEPPDSGIEMRRWE